MATTGSAKTSDEAVRSATGRGWGEWFGWLDEHGAADLDHKGIVQLLDADGELESGWWQQQVTVGYEQDHLGRRRPGQAADGSFQVGVRRTFRSSPARTWDLVASPGGASAWLGEAPDRWWHGTQGGPGRGDVLEAPGGEGYEVRSVAPGTRIRLATLGPALPRTTIQLTISGERGRTVVGLHQEGIPVESMREEMREHWKRALDRIGDLLDGE